MCCIKLQTSLTHYHHTKNNELGSNEEEETRQIQRMGHFLKVPFQGSEREKELGVVAHFQSRPWEAEAGGFVSSGPAWSIQ